MQCPFRGCKYQFLPYEVYQTAKKGAVDFAKCLAEETKEVELSTKEMKRANKRLGLVVSVLEGQKKECNLCKKKLRVPKMVTAIAWTNHYCCQRCYKEKLMDQARVALKISDLICPLCPKPHSNLPVPEEAEELIRNRQKTKLKWNSCDRCGERLILPSKLEDRTRDIYCDKCKCFYCRICNYKSHTGPCVGRQKVLFFLDIFD